MIQFNSTIEAERWFTSTNGAQRTFSCLVGGKPTTLTTFGTLGLIDVNSALCWLVMVS
jgi:hypothetical protein